MRAERWVGAAAVCFLVASCGAADEPETAGAAPDDSDQLAAEEQTSAAEAASEPTPDREAELEAPLAPAPTPAGRPAPTQISVSDTHACARLGDGSAVCWGIGSSGELGDGTRDPHPEGVRVTGISSVAAIAAGSSFTCAVADGGQTHCIGANGYGQLGGTPSDDPPAGWQRVRGIGSAAQLDAADGYACALFSSGQAQCWGINDYRQLGGRSGTSPPGGLAVLGVHDARALSVGGFACIVASDARAHCWGSNMSQRATQLDPTGVSSVSVGPSALTGCLIANGQVQCWGANESGQAGLDPYGGGEPQRQINTPRVVANLGRADGIAVALRHACAIVEGNVLCWGAEEGNPSFAHDSLRRTHNTSRGGSARQWQYCPEPTLVAGLQHVVEIDAGGANTCARTQEGRVACWNADGLRWIDLSP